MWGTERFVGAASGHSLGSPEQSRSRSAKVKPSVRTSHHHLPSVNRKQIYNVFFKRKSQRAVIMSSAVQKSLDYAACFARTCTFRRLCSVTEGALPHGPIHNRVSLESRPFLCVWMLSLLSDLPRSTRCVTHFIF